MLHTHICPSRCRSGLSRTPRAATSAPWVATACGNRGSGSSRGAAFPGSSTRPAAGFRELCQLRAQPGDQGSGDSRSLTILITPVLSPAPLAGATVGGQLLSSIMKEFSQLSLSSPPTRSCPGYAAGHAEPKPRYPRRGAQHSQPGATPSESGSGLNPGAELAAAAGRRRCRRSRAGLAVAARRGRRSGGMRQCRAEGLARLAAVLLGARGCRRRGRTAGAEGV